MSDGSPKQINAPSLLERRWVRLAAGFGILGLCVLQAVAALKLPFVEIRTTSQIFAIGGAQQTQNLHLILGATGIIGGALALYYAFSSVALRASFFVLGGVGVGFTGMLFIGAYQTIQRGAITDSFIYSQVKNTETVMQIGGGLWACLVAGLGILVLAVVVLLGNRPPPEDADAPLGRRRF